MTVPDSERSSSPSPDRPAASGRGSSSRSKAQAIVDAGGMTRREIMLVLIGLMAAMFLSSLSQTVVGTAMRTIADDLGGLSQQAWVTTAFLIVSTIVTPIYGKLSDIFGRRPLFLIAIVLFLFGSIASSFAQDMVQLAGFRALQGLGAGGLMSLPLTIMADVLAPRERAKYQGYFLAVFGISSVLGPLVGGLFAGSETVLGLEGWRWVFLFNLPIGVAALYMVWRFLHIPVLHKHVRVDWWGATALILGVVPLLLVAEQGRTWGWLEAPSIACYVISVVGIVAFILVERRMGRDALIPLGLFRSSTFSMATIISVFVGFGMFSGMMMIPFVLQLVHGMDPTQAGFAMIPMILGLMTASIGSGQIIARTGRYRIFPMLGTALMLAAYGVLTLLQFDSPYWMLLIGQLMLGLGLGQLMQTLTIASQNSVEARDMGVATASATFFRQLGGTMGTAVVFSVLYSRLPDTMAEAFAREDLMADLQAATQDPAVLADPANARILEVLGDPSSIGGSLDSDSSFLTGADPRLTAPFLDGFASATSSVFLVALVVVAIAFILTLFFRTPALKSRSAMEEGLRDQATIDQLQSEQTATGSIAVPVVTARSAVVDDALDDDAGGEAVDEQQPRGS